MKEGGGQETEGGKAKDLYEEVWLQEGRWGGDWGAMWFSDRTLLLSCWKIVGTFTHLNPNGEEPTETDKRRGHHW